MKQTIILLFALAFSSLAVCQSNSLQEGNNCFAKGDYACAIEKYKDALKLPDDRQKKIAGDNLKQAEKCFELHRMADVAFNSKSFIKAKEYYLSIINENPNDDKAKARLNEIKVALITISVSKNAVLFSSSGSKEIIYVTTEADSFVVGKLPSWCTVEKFEKYFEIKCTENKATTERTDYFNVSAGSKTEMINIRQSGKLEITLSVSKDNIFFSSSGGSESISLNTNATSYSINQLPAWCSVKKYAGYFIFNCTANNSTTFRNSYFTINAGNKTASIYISQKGKEVVEINTNKKDQLAQIQAQKEREEQDKANQLLQAKLEKQKIEEGNKDRRALNSFSSIGFQSGEIAKYGILYETGGKRTIGFHIAARTSLTAEDDILKGIVTANKTEIVLGPSIKFAKRIYLNIGAGYGYYNYIDRNDYAGTLNVAKAGYLVTTATLTIRITQTINVNGGVSFMDIDKDFYKPEITFGLSFNLKGKY